ncbi:MAG: sterol desaturase [Leptospiraceae bacterium]|nr:MAG: sterol desaturase [Leptospiraceae bacterium]
MAPNLILYAIPFFFLLIFLELLYCWIKKKSYYRLNDSIADLSTGIGNQLSGIIFKSFTLFGYIYLYQHFRIYTFDLSTPLKSIAAWILAFLLYDFFYYWFHRMSHEWNLFWASHVVHHSSEEYNLTVALRQPALGIFSWVFYLPLAIIGFSPEFYLLHAQINLIYQFWIHTRVIGKLGFLELFLNTPSHHRVHHGRNPEYIDKNYGGTLIIWDKLFGTFQEEKKEPAYGITRPLKTWNPVWANLHHYWDLIHFTFKAPKWKDKIKVWFSYPGWKPDYMKDYQYPSEKNKPFENLYQKYDTIITKDLSFYSLIWFTIIVLGTFIFLLKQIHFSNLENAISMGIIILSLVIISGILERQIWAYYGELLRLIGIIIFLKLFVLNNVLFLGMSIICIISFGFILKRKDLFDNKAETIIIDKEYHNLDNLQKVS